MSFLHSLRRSGSLLKRLLTPVGLCLIVIVLLRLNAVLDNLSTNPPASDGGAVAQVTFSSPREASDEFVARKDFNTKATEKEEHQDENERIIEDEEKGVLNDSKRKGLHDRADDFDGIQQQQQQQQQQQRDKINNKNNETMEPPPSTSSVIQNVSATKNHDDPANNKKHDTQSHNEKDAATSQNRHKATTTITRSADMHSLIDLLHTFPGSERLTLPVNGETLNQLMKHLSPWIYADLEHPMMLQSPGPPLVLNCSNPRYADVLSGKELSSPVFIMDVVGVGFDLDIIEIRLLELFEVVDVFVLYESGVTQTGSPKLFYFNESLTVSPQRWAPFLSKILYISERADVELKELLASLDALNNFEAKGKALEALMRTAPLKRILLPSTVEHSAGAPPWKQSPLVESIRKHMDTALVLQNDGDELITAPQVLHLKHCEAKKDPPFFFPLTVYKMNFEFAQVVLSPDHDEIGNKLLKQQGSGLSSALYGIYTQGAGACANTLRECIEVHNYSVPRPHPVRNVFDYPNFGPFAGIHMSEPADPVAIWYKFRTGLERQEDFMDSLLAPVVLDAIRAKNVTAALLSRHTSVYWYPKGEQDTCKVEWCRHTQHMSGMQPDIAREMKLGLPWPIRYNPKRYPFMVPAAGSRTCLLPLPKRWHSDQSGACGWVSVAPVTDSEMYPCCERDVTAWGSLTVE